MKKVGILNSQLIKTIADMGHTDQLVITDAGFPIAEEINRIDLSLTAGIPEFIKVLRAILDEMVVEKAIIADEMKEISPSLFSQVKEILQETPIESISHEEFKSLSANAKGVVRSGEHTPYANIILISGVDF